MHTPIREPLEDLRLCGLLPALTADGPEALAECITALDGFGFPFVEVEAVSQLGKRTLFDCLPPLYGLTVAVNAALAAQVRLAQGAAWTLCPAHKATEGTGACAEYRLCMVTAMHQPSAEGQTQTSGPSEATGNTASQKFGGRDLTGANAYSDVSGGAESQLSGEQALSGANTSHDAARGAASLPQRSSGCRIIDTAADGDTIASLLRDGNIAAARVAVRVTAQTARAVAQGLHDLWVQSLGFTLKHIGLNAADAAEADGVAAQFASLLGMAHASGPQSSYAGTVVEVMKGGGRGAHGHIGIGTASLPRAMYYASRRGFIFDWASRKDDAAGNPILYYLAQDIAGYAVHFLQQ
jgi:hypothetical protein